MNFTYDNYYSKLNIGYFDLKKYMKYLTPNEQAFIISKYGRNMRYDRIMEKFNLNLFEFNIIKNTSQLKMTLLMCKNLLPYQAKEVEEMKKVVYPELTEEEYDNYIWDTNEDLTKDYYAGKFDRELKVNKGKSKMSTISKKIKEKPVEKENTSDKETKVKVDKRRKSIEINEESKQNLIEHLKYFKPVEQVILIYAYKLFGENDLTYIGIAARFGLSLARISQIKKKLKDIVEKYIFSNNGDKYFKEQEIKGKIYKPFTKDNYNNQDLITAEDKINKDEKTLENNETELVENRQDIIDMLKYFTKAEQVCLVYGYGLFGVKKGDKEAMSKHFRKDFDINTVFIKASRKKRILSKPVEKMTEQEYFLYQQIISNEYEVNDESYYNKSLEKKKSEHSNKPDKDINLLRDINKLTYLLPKIQYVILANSGYYGEKLTLVEISKNLGYVQPQISRYKAYGELCLKLLNSEIENMTDDEKEQYNKLLKTNYGVLTKEEFENFPKTFEKTNKVSSTTKSEKIDKRKNRHKVLPEYFDIDNLIHFQPKLQVMMYLVYGLEDTKQYPLLKVAEAIGCNYNTLSRNIETMLEEIKILHTPYEKLEEDKKKVYDSLINKRYFKITKDNLFEYMPNKNSEIYFEEKGSTI